MSALSGGDLSIKRNDAMLLVIDVQEKLAPAMHHDLFARTLENLERLASAAEVLGVPVLMSEQYPKGLGHTVDRVRRAFHGAKVFSKVIFDAAGDPTIAEAIRAAGRPKILVTGIEAHICVYQTVRALARSHVVHVVRDAVASRTLENYETGLELSEAAGAIVTSTETVLFDLVEKAGTEEFKTISRLVR
jgi:isochorismate hydrolase